MPTDMLPGELADLAAQPLEELFKMLRTSATGLSQKEARERLLRLGPNALVAQKKLRPLFAFLEKFKSPLLIILMLASLVSFFLGEKTNGSIIIVMVFMGVVLDFVNTYKSERAVERLISRVATTATVLRDGAAREMVFRQIVPGDVVELAAGDVVPADCALIEAKDFFLNQSSLTGEAFPVERFASHAQGDERRMAAETANLVFGGSSAVSGFAKALVLKTGAYTEYGKISASLAGAEPETAFDRGIRNFSMLTMRLTFALVAFLVLANAVLGRGIFDSFLFALAIAIGLTPELLPVVISVSLSRGSVRMAAKDVIVKNLSSIENFGGMDILCTDKTGTLTEDRIVLMKCVDGAGEESDAVFLHAYLASVYHTGIKSPLDHAIKDYRSVDIGEYHKIDEIPFDFARKRDAVVVERAGTRTLIVKGAPEELLKISTQYVQGGKTVPLADAERTIREEFNRLSAEGFRVLGIGVRALDGERDMYGKEEEHAMAFLGFAAFLDPPKPTAKIALENLRELGIEIKILTGDNEVLTRRVCADIQLNVRGMLQGDDIALLDDRSLQEKAENTTVFARVTPEQKERIIRVLRRAGHTVGYLGDGINDAPSLKAADVGISVKNAADVAKETADIVLVKKSLEVLKEGVMEGRKAFQNTMKYILMGLSSNFGNMFSMAGTVFFLPFLPMLPAQILFNNLLYDLSQVSLPSDAVDDDAVRVPPKWDFGFIKRFMLVFGLTSSIFDFLTFFVLYKAFNLSAASFQTGWFIESIAAQTLVIYLIRTRKIPFIESSPSMILVFSTLAVLSVGWLTALTPIGRFLHFVPLPLPVIGVIVGITLLYLGAAEFMKRRVLFSVHPSPL